MTFRPSLAAQLAEIHLAWADTLARLISFELAVRERQARLTRLLELADELASELEGDNQQLAKQVCTELRFLA